MDICDYNHERIVYNSTGCPMCDLAEQLADNIKVCIEVEDAFNEKVEAYQRLIDAVTEHSPELLI